MGKQFIKKLKIMKQKIEKLLAKKVKERKEINKAFCTKPFTCNIFERDYSEKMDKLNIEIDILQTLLKD